MGRKRQLIAAMLVLVIGAAAYGAAASLGGLTSNTLGAGSSSVVSCDGNGVTTTYTVSGGNVTEVTVGDIAAGCNGGQLKLTLANSSGTSIGSGGPLAVSGTSLSVPVAPQPSAASVAALHITITGP